MVGFAQEQDINFDRYSIVSLPESKIGTHLLDSSDVMVVCVLLCVELNPCRLHVVLLS